MRRASSSAIDMENSCEEGVSGYFDVHQRRVLLSAVSVAVVDVPLNCGARDRGFHRERIVDVKELHLLGRKAVALRNDFARERARALHSLVALVVLEHDVERELERACVLAADEPGEVCQSGHDTVASET